MQQALTNVLLMDAVVGCLQLPKAILAASNLAYYDKMKKECRCTKTFPNFNDKI